jgi:serine O-acetyltransferase
MNIKFESDYYRMTGITASNKLKVAANMLFKHNIRYMYLHRKYENRPNLLTKYMLYTLGRKYGLEISCDAHIGSGLYLGHPYNITVAEGTTIGKNVNLHKGCTIGRENRGSHAGVPTIGDRVYVGIGAVIVGGITIGDDVLIAPNSFVNFDVPSHSIVIGNPASVHPRSNATESYVNFLV